MESNYEFTLRQCLKSSCTELGRRGNQGSAALKPQVEHSRLEW